jgi:hypothetical protein
VKSLVAKFTLVALFATPCVSPAQHVFPSNDPHGNLTLLPGPDLLSPANATGEVVPGQMWKLKKNGFLMLDPPAQARTFVVSGTGAFSRQLSSPTLTIGGGTLTFRAAPGSTTLKTGGGTLTLGGNNGSPAQRPDSVPRAEPIATPLNAESLRFDSKLPQTEIRPLQKKPAAKPESF